MTNYDDYPIAVTRGRMQAVADGDTRQRRWDELVRHLLDAPGHLEPETRRAVFAGEGIPDELAGLVDTVARHAYRVTDSQVDAVQHAGYNEDQVFEAIVVASMAAGDRRLRSARRAMSGR